MNYQPYADPAAAEFGAVPEPIPVPYNAVTGRPRAWSSENGTGHQSGVSFGRSSQRRLSKYHGAKLVYAVSIRFSYFSASQRSPQTTGPAAPVGTFGTQLGDVPVAVALRSASTAGRPPPRATPPV